MSEAEATAAITAATALHEHIAAIIDRNNQAFEEAANSANRNSGEGHRAATRPTRIMELHEMGMSIWDIAAELERRAELARAEADELRRLARLARATTPERVGVCDAGIPEIELHPEEVAP